jgi:hypothetical protein
VVYDVLFRAAAETLRVIAADSEHLGAETGFLGVLYTWGQNLLHYPHIHFLVPGGGIAPDGDSWIACRPGFFLQVRVLRTCSGIGMGRLVQRRRNPIGGSAKSSLPFEKSGFLRSDGGLGRSAWHVPPYRYTSKA